MDKNKQQVACQNDMAATTASDFAGCEHDHYIPCLGKDKYFSLFQNSRDAITIVEPPTWRFTYGNEAAVKLFGIKDAADLVTYEPWRLSPELQPDGELSSLKAQKMLQLAIQQGSHFFEWTHQSLTGEVIITEVTLTRINLNNQVFIQALTRDITPRKKMEEYMRRLSAIVESTADAINSINLDAVIIDWNKSAELLYGYTRKEILGTSVFNLIPQEHHDEFHAIMQKIKQGKNVKLPETWRRNKAGIVFPVSMTVSVLRDYNGNICGAAAIIRDITERKQAEKSIKESEARFRSIVFMSQDAILVVNTVGKIVYMNPAAEAALQQRIGDLLDHDIDLSTIEHRTIEIAMLRPGRDPGIGEVRITATEWFEEKGYLVVVRDITEQKHLFDQLQQSEARLKIIAQQDMLTGLPNRYQFMQVIDRSIAYAARHDLTLAVFSMDLDKFKEVNDTCGHDVGDLLLKEVAARLRACSRKEDFIARLGGDEFMMLMLGVQNRQDANAIAQKILKAVKQQYIINGHEIYISVSIGVAFFSATDNDREVLLKQADMAMYQAKHAGRDGYQIYQHKD